MNGAVLEKKQRFCVEIGEFREFASGGPIYEIRDIDRENEMVTIHIPETDEELEYPLSKITGDRKL